VTLKPELHAAAGQPVGLPVADATPGPRPGPVTLQGRTGSVERLSAARHGPSLWDAVRGHDEIWTYMSAYGPFAEAGAFSTWLGEREKLTDPYYYTVLDPGGRAGGLSALMEIKPAMRVVEVGHVVYSPALQRTPLATEAQYLLARYVFETLRYRRYEWKCHSDNEPSRRAALRFGFSFECVMRQHMIAKDRNRDTAWFAMLDGEWPERKARFERWLSPDNFDNDGRQKTSLRQ
jgi:RimJ/RimL family protein N-acetyltransferase